MTVVENPNVPHHHHQEPWGHGATLQHPPSPPSHSHSTRGALLDARTHTYERTNDLERMSEQTTWKVEQTNDYLGGELYFRMTIFVLADSSRP
jgi:hypothetical protein